MLLSRLQQSHQKEITTPPSSTIFSAFCEKRRKGNLTRVKTLKHTPSSNNMSLLEMVGLGTPKDPVILDIGTAYTRLGIANEPVPRQIIRTEVKILQNNTCTNVPILKGFDKLNDEEILQRLKKFFHLIYFKHLLVNPRERRVIILESMFYSMKLKTFITKTLFDYFDVPSILFAPSHLFALFPLGISTALVVDCGYFECTVIPVFEQSTLLSSVQSLPSGSMLVHKHLKEKINKIRDADGIDTNEKIIEDIKVKLGFVGTHPNPLPNLPPVKYPISSSEILKIDIKTRESCYDIIFDNDDEDRSISSIILDAIIQSPIDCRKKLSENILLIGGTTMAPGFHYRLHTNINNLLNTTYSDKLAIKNVKFLRLPIKANFISWLGGAIYGTLDTLPEVSFTKEQYNKGISLPDWSSYLKTLVEPAEAKQLAKDITPRRLWSKRPSLQKSVSASPLHQSASSRKMSAS